MRINWLIPLAIATFVVALPGIAYSNQNTVNQGMVTLTARAYPDDWPTQNPIETCYNPLIVSGGNDSYVKAHVGGMIGPGAYVNVDYHFENWYDTDSGLSRLTTGYHASVYPYGSWQYYDTVVDYFPNVTTGNHDIDVSDWIQFAGTSTTAVGCDSCTVEITP